MRADRLVCSQRASVGFCCASPPLPAAAQLLHPQGGKYDETREEERVAGAVPLLELQQENSKLTTRLLQLRSKCEQLEADKFDLNVSLLQR